MQYNKCETCGACDGRAGNLISKAGGPFECMNCHDTRASGNFVVHLHLDRTDEELTKTGQILTAAKV